jgi:anti-sigma regulatory factor (Ser/Thr protein kinase)
MCHEERWLHSGDPSAPIQARRFCAEQLELAFGDAAPGSVLASDVELIASELVTNAVKAGPADVALELVIHRDLISVAVTDSAPGVARMRDPSPDADSGRGLLIVDRLATSWGVDYLAGGKRVWAELPVPLSLVLSANCSR